MPTNTTNHRGHTVTVHHEADQPATLRIDGDHIAYSQLGAEAYATQLLPHATFRSLQDLAAGVINGSPQFNGRRDLT